MTYAELIEHFWRASGLSIKEYAQRINYSPNQLSLVLNGHQDGSLKLVTQCVKDAGMDMQDLLSVPASADTAEEKKAMRAFKSLAGEHRDTALKVLGSLADLQAAQEKQRSKRG